MKSHILPVLICLVALFGCTTSRVDPGFTCASCRASEIKVDYLKVKVTLNADNPAVPLIIYKGNFTRDTNLAKANILMVDTAKISNDTISVPLNNYYTVVAKYKSGSKIVYAIDGDNIKASNVDDYCDVTCWTVVGGNIDVTLKQ